MRVALLAGNQSAARLLHPLTSIAESAHILDGNRFKSLPAAWIVVTRLLLLSGSHSAASPQQPSTDTVSNASIPSGMLLRREWSTNITRTRDLELLGSQSTGSVFEQRFRTAFSNSRCALKTRTLCLLLSGSQSDRSPWLPLKVGYSSARILGGLSLIHI